MATKKSSSPTVNIACKLPQGLVIHLPERVTLKLHGYHSPYAHSGHGVTRGVPAAHWDAVKTLHADATWLKNELVFAMPDLDSVNDKAEERADVQTGFEPIDPAKLAKDAESAQNGRIGRGD